MKRVAIVMGVVVCAAGCSSQPIKTQQARIPSCYARSHDANGFEAVCIGGPKLAESSLNDALLAFLSDKCENSLYLLTEKKFSPNQHIHGTALWSSYLTGRVECRQK